MVSLVKKWLTPPAGHKLLFSNRDLLRLFLPVILEQFLVVLAGFTDSLMAVALGEAAVSGISLIDNIMILLILVFAALATGGSVIMGQYLGHQEPDQAKETGRQLVWMAGLISLALMAIFYACKPLILYHLYEGIEADVLSNASDYLNVIGISIPFIALFQAGSMIFRTAGNTKFPMLIVFGADVFNIIGNYTAIYILRWGVFGTALSTLLSRILSVVVVLYGAQHLHFLLTIPPLLKVRLNRDLIGRMLRVGIPFSVENGLFQFGKVVVVSVIASFGTGAIAANAVGTVFTNFQVLPGMAMNTAMTAVVARCLGAGDIPQSRYYTRKIIALIMGTNLVVTLLSFAAWPLILFIYRFPQQTMDWVWEIIFWHGTLQVLVWPLAFTLPVTFRSAGDAQFAMVVGAASMMLVRVGGAFLLCGPLHFDMFGTWIAMFLDWAARAIIYVPRYRKGTYLKHKLI